MEQSPSGEASITQLVKKFAVLYGTRCFITVFTGARHWSLSWTRWIQWRFILHGRVFMSITLRGGSFGYHEVPFNRLLQSYDSGLWMV